MAETEKNFPCLEPDYVAKFSCKPEICRAQCCTGFRVDVDKQMHLKYRDIQDRELRTKILDSCVWMPDLNVYGMKLENATCPMLCEDYSCLLQEKLGDDFLPDVCVDFPYRVCIVGKISIRTLSLTCPVAAESVLFNPETMKFRSLMLRTKRTGSLSYYPLNGMTARNVLLFIQGICTEMLQNRKFSLNMRLAITGVMMSMIDYRLNELTPEVVKEFGEIFKTPEFFARMERNFHNAEFYKKLYLQFMFSLTEELFNNAVTYYSTRQRNFIQYVGQAFGMVDTVSKPPEEVEEIYEEIFSAYEKFVLEPYPTLLENYVVHNLFTGIYPCRIPGSLMQNWFFFVTLFKVFEFALMCMAGVLKENLTRQDIIDLAGRFAHRITHGHKFEIFTLEYLKKHWHYSTELFYTLIDLKK